MTYKHIVLDLETLGIKPGAPVLSIGATAFSLEHDDTRQFYVKLRLAQQSMAGLDADTLLWWIEQEDSAFSAAFTENQAAETLWTAVQLFSIWFEQIRREADQEPCVWGNSNSFDNEILRELFERCGFEAPWSFRSDRDFRTLRALYKDKVPEPPFEGIRHHAKDDSAHEANWLRSILIHCNLADQALAALTAD